MHTFPREREYSTGNAEPLTFINSNPRDAELKPCSPRLGLHVCCIPDLGPIHFTCCFGYPLLDTVMFLLAFNIVFVA